jgi:hypothetical protein
MERSDIDFEKYAACSGPRYQSVDGTMKQHANRLYDMKLYWATTQDGYENWFVFAESCEGAADFHESAEGFNPGDASAQYICDISEDLIRKYKLIDAGWPNHELLKDLGGKIITESNPRKVNINGRIYIEGTFSEGIFFDSEDELTGVYVIKIQNTDKYKIGKTTNLKKRIKQFATGNPENIKIVYFVETKHYQSLEKHLHELFKNERIGGEWFLFDKEKLEDVEANLALLQVSEPEYFKIYNVKKISIQGRVY